MTPTFGSIVQNGKLAACAFAFDKQLKSVDLPTFGKPTMPHFKPMIFFISGREGTHFLWKKEATVISIAVTTSHQTL